MAASKNVVVIAVDGSDFSEKAFDWYVKTSHRPDNRVVVAHCMEQPPYSGGYVVTMHGAYGNPEAWNKMYEASKATCDRLTEKYTKKLADNNVPGEVRVLEGGSAGQAISAFAQDESATHIVIGSRGLNAIRRTLLGSISDYVLHHAHVFRVSQGLY